jgi:hypothetical protein
VLFAVSRLLALAAGMLALAGAPSANAGSYPMHQCASGVPAVSLGWSTFGYTTNATSTLHNTCSSGGTIGVYAFTNGQAGAVTENGSSGSEIGLALNVPGSAPDVSISSIGADVLASSVSGDDAFLGFSSEGQALAGSAELPYGGGADYKASESWILPQGARDFEAYVNCTTDRSSPTCYFTDSISLPALSEVTINLIDAVRPTVSSVAGVLASAAASGSTVAGSQAFSFTASDVDSGVHSGTLTLTPKGVGSALTHSFDFSMQCGYDAWNACPVSQSVGGFAVDTSALKDDIYSVDLAIADAAGNVVHDDLGTVTSHNAPVNSSVPGISVSGQAAVGLILSAQLGAWSAPSGAGSITYAYQWESCDGSGEACYAIAGAHGDSYSPVGIDVGRTLRVSVTATNDDGSAAASSVATGIVAGHAGSLAALPGFVTDLLANHSGVANGTGASEAAHVEIVNDGLISRSFARRALQLRGRLLDGQRHAIGGASLDILQQVAGSSAWQRIAQSTSQPDGSFLARVPGGASRLIEIAYRAFAGDDGYAARARIQERVKAGVQLTIAPRRTGPNGSIMLSGAVQGPIPPQGTIVELLVHYLGRWEPFRTPRTNAAGRFRVAYGFQGGVGRFPFRAEVPGGQTGFPFAAGDSRSITVVTG